MTDNQESLIANLYKQMDDLTWKHRFLFNTTGTAVFKEGTNLSIRIHLDQTIFWVPVTYKVIVERYINGDLDRKNSFLIGRRHGLFPEVREMYIYGQKEEERRDRELIDETTNALRGV